jgi:hypothetical protein
MHESGDLPFTAYKETIHRSINAGRALFSLVARLPVRSALPLHFLR